MALTSETGVFSANTGTGNQTVNLPNGFDPKAIILWTAGLTTAGVSTGAAVMSIGFGTYDGGTVQQGHIHLRSETISTAEQVSGGAVTTRILRTNSGDNVADCEASLVSLTNGSPSSFTINWTDAPGSAIRIHYLALGGSDITGARVFSYTDSTTTPQSVTVNAGFGKPDVIFLMSRMTGTSGDSGVSSAINFGVGTATNPATSGRATSFRAADVQTTSVITSYQKGNFFNSISSSAATKELALDAVVNWPTDGFKVTKATATTTDFCVGLAVKGTFAYSIGTSVTPTASPPRTVDYSSGIANKAALCWGTGFPASASVRGSGTGFEFGIGAVDTNAHNGFAGITDADAVTSTSMVQSRLHSETSCWQRYNTTPTIEAEASADISGDTVRFTYPDTDSTGCEFNVLVLGDKRIVPTSVASTEAFGTPTVAPGEVSVSPTAVASEEATGVPTVAPGEVSVSPTAVASEEAFGTPTVTPGEVSVSPTAVASEEAFGSPSIDTGPVTIEAGSIGSGEQLGDLSVTPGAVALLPSSVPTAESVSAAAVSVGAVSVDVDGIGSDESFGDATVLPGAVTIAAGSIVSAEVFGTSLVAPVQTVTAVAILTAEAFGVAKLAVWTEQDRAAEYRANLVRRMMLRKARYAALAGNRDAATLLRARVFPDPALDPETIALRDRVAQLMAARDARARSLAGDPEAAAALREAWAPFEEREPGIIP